MTTEKITIEEIRSLYFLIQSGKADSNTMLENYGTIKFGEGKQTPEGGCIFPYVLTSKEDATLRDNYLSIAALAIRQAEELEWVHKENSRLVIEKQALRSALKRGKTMTQQDNNKDAHLEYWYKERKAGNYPSPPNGMVELRFLSIGRNGNLSYEDGSVSPYSYKPVENFFMEVLIGDDFYRLDFGKCTGPTGLDQYGINIHHPFDVKSQQHSANACDITRPYLVNKATEELEALQAENAEVKHYYQQLADENARHRELAYFKYGDLVDKIKALRAENKRLRKLIKKAFSALEECPSYQATEAQEILEQASLDAHPPTTKELDDQK